MVFAFTAACGPTQEPAAKPLVWGMLDDVETLNPILSEASNEVDIMNGIFSTLIKVDENLNYVPDLLTKLPEVSEDGLEYTFELRDDVLFHDGEPLTAEDVYFTYQMQLAESLISKIRWEKIESFNIVDDHNFVIIIKDVDVTWLEGWAYAESMIVPKHIMEPIYVAGGDTLTKGDAFSRDPVGSGPYKFGEWQTSEYIKLEAFDGYFRGEPAIKEVIFKVIPDTNSMLAQFINGDIDIYDRALPNQYQELLSLKEDGQDIVVHNYPSFIYTHADFNLRLPVFQDKAVRQALNYAFPKEKFIETVLDGVGTVAHSNTPPMSWAYNTNVKQYEFNPDKAVEILEDAGWEMGADGVRVKDGLRLSFTLTTNSGNTEREEFQSIAKQEWDAIGADVNIQNYETPTLWEKIDEIDFEIAIFAWASGFDPDSETLWHSRQRPDEFGSGQNYPGYVNPRIDELLEAGKQETDRGRRTEIYHEIQEILSEDVPVIFLNYWNNVTAVPGNLKNFKPNATQANNTWNIFEWILE
jgi:peptide/nickel transport system substrate-binding protein